MRAAPGLVALILALASPAHSQQTSPAPAAVIRVERDALTLLVNPTEDTPGIAVCVAWPSDSGQLSSRLARILVERGGRHETTRWAGGSVDCFELPQSELPTGLWLAAQRATEISRQTTTNTESEQTSIELDARRRIGALALTGGDATEDGVLLPVVTVSGPVDVERVDELTASYFANVPGSRLASRDFHQTTERLNVVEDSRAVRPLAHVGWLVPADAVPAIETALTILAGGDLGRLDVELVRKRKSADAVDAFSAEYAGAHLAGLQIRLAEHATVDRVQRFVDGSLKQLRIIGPTRNEVARAQALLGTRALVAQQRPLWRALSLAESALAGTDPNGALHPEVAYAALTPDLVRDAARKYLVQSRRNVVEVYPPDYPEDDPRLTGFDLYTVQKGDTWASLENQFKIPASVIAADNDLDTKYLPSPGQALWIRPR